MSEAVGEVLRVEEALTVVEGVPLEVPVGLGVAEGVSVPLGVTEGETEVEREMLGV